MTIITLIRPVFNRLHKNRLYGLDCIPHWHPLFGKKHHRWGYYIEEIIRIYGKRWDIEVFFKVSKSYLALAKEFQGRSYDMMIAHTTIVFMRNAMLALESRNSNDLRTIGDLFFYMCDEVEDIKFSVSLMLVIELLRNLLNENPVISEEVAHQIMDAFIKALPKVWTQKLKLSA